MTDGATDARALPADPDRPRPRVAPDPKGRGVTFVTLMSCLERCMHESAHVFPAADHMSPLPTRPTVEELDVLATGLQVHATGTLCEAFARWRAAQDAFLAAAEHLDAMKTPEARASRDYQMQLEQRIHELRELRVTLRAAADDLRTDIANDLGD